MADRGAFRLDRLRRAKRLPTAAAPGEPRPSDVPHALVSILQLQRTAGNHAVQRLLEGGDPLRRPFQRKERRKGPRPLNIAGGPGTAHEIEEAYAAGTLDPASWAALVDHADQAAAAGQNDEALRAYSTLYRDAATVAQASRVVPSSGGSTSSPEARTPAVTPARASTSR